MMAKTRSPKIPTPKLCWSCRWFYDLPQGKMCVLWTRKTDFDFSCTLWCDPEYRWPIPEEKRDKYLGAD